MRRNLKRLAAAALLGLTLALGIYWNDAATANSAPVELLASDPGGGGGGNGGGG